MCNSILSYWWAYGMFCSKWFFKLKLFLKNKIVFIQYIHILLIIALSSDFKAIFYCKLVNNVVPGFENCVILILSSPKFPGRRNWGENFPNVTEMVSSRVKTWIQTISPPRIFTFFNLYSSLISCEQPMDQTFSNVTLLTNLFLLAH